MAEELDVRAKMVMAKSMATGANKLLAEVYALIEEFPNGKLKNDLNTEASLTDDVIKEKVDEMSAAISTRKGI
jgi:hypothetical protein